MVLVMSKKKEKPESQAWAGPGSQVGPRLAEAAVTHSPETPGAPTTAVLPVPSGAMGQQGTPFCPGHSGTLLPGRGKRERMTQRVCRALALTLFIPTQSIGHRRTPTTGDTVRGYLKWVKLGNMGPICR